MAHLIYLTPYKKLHVFDMLIINIMLKQFYYLPIDYKYINMSIYLIYIILILHIYKFIIYSIILFSLWYNGYISYYNILYISMQECIIMKQQQAMLPR